MRLVGAAFLVASLLWTGSTVAQTTRVNVGVSATIDQHGTCRLVTNGCASDIMVPHNISAEWTSFINDAPGCATRAACPLTNFSVVGTSTGNGTSASMPAGFQSGDLLVLYTFVDSNLTGYTATSTTQIAGHASDGSSIRTFAKIMDGGESGGVGGLLSGTQWIALVLRPNGSMTSFTAHSASTSFNWQFQSNTLSSGSAPRKPAVALGSFGAPFNVVTNGSVNPTSMTTVAGAATTHEAHYYVFGINDTLGNFTFSLNDGGSRQKTQTVTLVFN